MKINKEKVRNIERHILEKLDSLNDDELKYLYEDRFLQKIKRNRTVSIKCCICEKDLEATNYAHQDLSNFFKDAMVDNGHVSIIVPSYGSDYDNSKLVVAFCDECIFDKLSDRLILTIKEKGITQKDLDG